MPRASNFQIKIAEQVIDEAIMDNKPHYLIKWKDLPHQNDTWQSIQNLQSIVQMVQKWIRKHRQNNSKNNFSHASSYCDTINYRDPMKKVRRKKKMIRKPRPKKHLQNQIVVLDQDIESVEDGPNKFLIKQQYNDNDSEECQSSSKIQDLNTKNEMIEAQNKWNPCESSDKIISESTNIPRKVRQSLNFNPQDEKQQPQQHTTQNLKKGMKVIGRVRAQDIQQIIQHFKFKQAVCYKIQLKDGKITNMRSEDLKKLCPQMLMEYFEDNDIKV